MRRIAILLALAACSDADARRSRPEHEKPGELVPVPVSSLCVTHGAVTGDDSALAVADPTTRAFAYGSNGDAVALRFTYRGPTDTDAKLASGEVRRQVGLKLRAQNSCNLVYVMWRIYPKPGLEVQVKRNPGAKTNEDCGVDGYTKVKPKKKKSLALLEKDVEHTLAAYIDGDDLVASVDGAMVWRGRLPKSARDLFGPAGIRSDNVTFDGELLADGDFTAPPKCE